MLDHPNIAVRARRRRIEQIVASCDARITVFTGPIDAYFGHCFGTLPYRSLRFEHEHLAGTAQYQSVGTVNFPNDHDYTRITEFKHLTGQAHAGTSIVREYPAAPRATRTTRSRTRPTKRSSSATRRWPRPRATCTSSAAWRSTATTTWTRCVGAALALSRKLIDAYVLSEATGLRIDTTMPAPLAA